MSEQTNAGKNHQHQSIKHNQLNDPPSHPSLPTRLTNPYYPNPNNKSVIKTNRAIWQAIYELSEAHLDEFPFSVREAIRHTNLGGESIVSQKRGGLKQFLCTTRSQLIESLSALVATEQQRTGQISDEFCGKLILLLAEHHEPIMLDLITFSYRNTLLIVQVFRPLIIEKHYDGFYIDFYLWLRDWQQQDFSRSILLDKQGKRLRGLFRKYQITRPDAMLPHVTLTESERTKLS